ncbi:TPA: SGNH/GDSL hydrolase family protein [Serratia marcescens]|nr:hypothetical protein SMKC034_12720 [Serratia marcescens]
MSNNGLPVTDVVGVSVTLGQRRTAGASAGDAYAQAAQGSAVSAANSAAKATQAELGATQAAEGVAENAVIATDAATKAETAAESAQNIADANTFYTSPTDPDGTIAGIVGTPNGKSFRVGLGKGKGFKYYINNSGVALEISESPGADSFKRMIPGARLDIISSGKNKFDKSQVVRGYYLYEGNGQPTVNERYCYSDFIPLNPGSTYSSTPPQLPTSPARVATFYDENYKYMSDISSVDNFTAPQGAAFVRVSVLLADLETYQLSLGVGYSNYEKYEYNIKQGVNLYPALGFSYGKNRFNPNSVVDGVHLSSIGTIFLDANRTRSVSDYIKIDASLPFACNQQWLAAAYYDEHGAFISRQYDSDFATKPVNALVIPQNAKYLRIELPTSVVTATQIESGTSLATEFEPFRLESPNSVTSEPVQYGTIPVSIERSGLFTAGQNLFNNKTVKSGYINEWGSIFPGGVTYVYSDYIAVAAGEILRSGNTLRFVTFYDAAKSFISTVANVTQAFTAPQGAEFVRVTVSAGLAANLLLVKGAYLPKRQDYVHVMSGALPDGASLRIPGSIILQDSLSLDFVQQGLLVSGKNLYNSITTDAGFIDESGVINPGGTAYRYSAYIPVKPDAIYSLNTGARFVGLYDMNKGFIRTIAASNSSILSVTTDSDCYFIRITMRTSTYADLQLELGGSSTAYEPFAYSLLSHLPDGTPVNGGNISDDGVTPDSYGLERLRETHMRLMKMTYGDPVRLAYAMIGDSYTRGQVRYALKVAQKLWNKFNNTAITTIDPPLGYGWRSFGFDQFGDNTDIIGTLVNQSANVTCAYNTGHGPDISSVTMGAAGATISYTQDLSKGFTSTLYAEGGAGVVQYQVTGMTDPVQIDLSTYPAGMQIIPLTIPPGGSASTVTWTCVTAPAVLYGVKIVHPTASGVIVHKMGGSGSHSNNWVAAMDARWSAAFTDLAPDLVTIMLGTNDQGAKISAATFRSNMLTMIDTIRAVRPTADILLICPAENNRPGGNIISMTTYADVMYKVARDDRDVAFLNLQGSFGEKASDYAAGSARPWMVGDGLHPAPETGGYAIAAAILRSLRVPQ